MLLPDINVAEYLVRHWHEAGTVSNTGMGITALSWQEIRAWRIENDLTLEPFELNFIRQLSSEYVSEYYAATDKSREPPYQEIKEEDIDRAAISNKIFNVLSSYKRNTDDNKYTEEE